MTSLALAVAVSLASLPYDLYDRARELEVGKPVPTDGAALTADEIAALRKLFDLGPADAEVKLVGKLTIPGATGVLLRSAWSHEMDEGYSTQLALFVSRNKGASVKLDGQQGSEAGGYTRTATLDGPGRFKTVETFTYPVHDWDAASEVVSEQLCSVSIVPTGAGLVSCNYERPTGVWEDPKSKEQLYVANGGELIGYRARDGKPMQTLTTEFRGGLHAATVRFKKDGKPYELKWDPRYKELRCTNPDKSLQTFARKF